MLRPHFLFSFANMNTLLIVTICLTGLLLAMNLYISYLVAKSDFYESTQKYVQYALIWLLPVIGAIACYLFVQPTLGTGSSKSTHVEDDGFATGDLPSHHHD